MITRSVKDCGRELYSREEEETVIDTLESVHEGASDLIRTHVGGLVGGGRFIHEWRLISFETRVASSFASALYRRDHSLQL